MLQEAAQKSSKIAIFKGQQIRKIIHKDEWFFSIVDIIQVLTDSSNPRRYWSDLKKKLTNDEGFIQLYEKIVQFKLIASDGKMRETDTANTETIFRIIQSIPSPNAEPFKRWLAKVGYEGIQKIEDSELATKRTRARMRGIAVREKLTNEWLQRDIKEDKEYAILTAEISKATFGLNLRT